MRNYDFLNDFTKRMKSVGRFAVLFQNSILKGTWKKFDIDSMDEQVNLIFTIMLYIMECSLREEDCTIDDISAFVGEMDDYYYKKNYSYDMHKELADFVVNVILGNSGTAMYFKGYDYEKSEYEDIHISYIANKVIYQENGVRRTSYYLTDEGYNMMLSTMELENNLKLTIHDMLFKLHLEKADYNRAVNDIKNVFEQLRIQNQKIQEAIHRIRQNALAYTIDEYRSVVEENIGTIEKTRSEFKLHKEVVEARVRDFEEQEIDSSTFDEKDREGLNNLKIISNYLNRALDEHQKILNEHFDLKTLYDMELENYSGMNMIQRYNLRSEIYERVLKDVNKLDSLEEILRPLYWNNEIKIYNPNKAMEYQRRINKSDLEDDGTIMDFDEDAYKEERECAIREKMQRYQKSCSLILSYLNEKKEISLSMMKDEFEQEQIETMIPSVEVFREIMIEFLTEGCIDIDILKKEKSAFLVESMENFHLNEMVLEILEENHYSKIKKIYIKRSEIPKMVCFENVYDEYGSAKKIKCSDILLSYE